MSFILFHGGERRVKEFFLKKEKKIKNKNIKKWIAQKNIYNIFKKEEVKSTPDPVNPWFILFKVPP